MSACTQPNKDNGRGNRSSSADAGQSGSVKKGNSWVPDYTVRAVTDVLYLKVRKSTYMVAANATKMNTYQKDKIKDEDIDEIFTEATNRSEGDLTRRSPPSLLSPDITWEDGIVQSMLGSPSDPRQLSLKSSMSNIKTKLAEGRSSSSIDRGLNDKPSHITLAFDDDEVERKSLIDKENRDEEEEKGKDDAKARFNGEGQESGATTNSDRAILLENSVT